MLRDIEKFLNATGMKPTRFGREVAGDPRLVLDMRNGRQPSQPMRDKIRTYIQENGK